MQHQTKKQAIKEAVSKCPFRKKCNKLRGIKDDS